MIEAVRTTASPAAIWAVCVVMVLCLAFWLIAVHVASRNPASGSGRMPSLDGSVVGGIHVAAGGRSVAPNRDTPAAVSGIGPGPWAGPAAEPGPTAAATPAARAGSGARVPPAAEPGAQPARPPVPGQRAGEPRPAGAGHPAGAQTQDLPDQQEPAARAMPAQRGGEADQPTRSSAGSGTSDQRRADR